MPRNDGVDRLVARNCDLKPGKTSTPENAYAHNERKKESYSNPDIIPERTPLNVHFKSPGGTYLEMFDALEQDKIISTWGMKPDSTKLCELVFDVNSAYFFNHGGYEFAKQFYADAYRAAIEIVGGEQYILSAVMHADERNRAMSEALGQDVYHYHLHVVYVPVVEKKILWSKRCKDPALVGTVKEIKPQVSRTKKWANVPALDEAGNPMRNSKGKPILRRSYAVLQDDFYNFMLSAGYTDVQRGERGSTEEHLTVTQFKVEQEQKRLASLQAESREKETELAALEEKTTQAEETLDEVSRKADTAQARLNALTPKLKDAEGFVEKYLGDPEKLLPEAGALEYASHYRSRKALPLVEKLKALALSLYRKLQDLRRDFRALQSKFDSVSHDRDIYKRRWEKARDENETLKAELVDYDSLKQELGPVQLQAALSRSKSRQEAEKAARKVQKRPQQTRPGQDAR